MFEGSFDLIGKRMTDKDIRLGKLFISGKKNHQNNDKSKNFIAWRHVMQKDENPSPILFTTVFNFLEQHTW